MFHHIKIFYFQKPILAKKLLVYFLLSIHEITIVKKPNSTYITAYMTKSKITSCNVIQYDIKNIIAKDIGNHHSLLISLPTNKQTVIEDTGLIAKKNAIITPIVSCGCAKFISVKGNISNTTNSIIDVIVSLLFSFILIITPRRINIYKLVFTFLYHISSIVCFNVTQYHQFLRVLHL